MCLAIGGAWAPWAPPCLRHCVPVVFLQEPITGTDRRKKTFKRRCSEHACTRTVVETYNNNSLHHGLAFFGLFWAICIRRNANGATQCGLGLE